MALYHQVIVKIIGSLIMVIGLGNIIFGSSWLLNKGGHNLSMLVLLGVYLMISGIGFMMQKKWSLVMLQLPLVLFFVVLVVILFSHYNNLPSVIWLVSMQIMTILFAVVIMYHWKFFA